MCLNVHTDFCRNTVVPLYYCHTHPTLTLTTLISDYGGSMAVLPYFCRSIVNIYHNVIYRYQHLHYTGVLQWDWATGGIYGKCCCLVIKKFTVGINQLPELVCTFKIYHVRLSFKGLMTCKQRGTAVKNHQSKLETWKSAGRVHSRRHGVHICQWTHR